MAQGRAMSKDEEIAALKRENEQLRKEMERLSHDNQELRKQVEAWRRGLKERPKRRCSQPETKRRAVGPGPGRRAGFKGQNRPVPEEIHQTVFHPAPSHCECGGEVETTERTQSTIVQEIKPAPVENIEHAAQVGRCKQCGRRVSVRLPGASKDGDATTQVQLGPNLQARIISLRYEHHLPHRRIARLLSQCHNLKVSAGAIAHLLRRTSVRYRKAEQEIEAAMQVQPVIGVDETPLKQDGRRGYAWLMRTDKASWFRIEPSRGAKVFDQMLGEGFQGVVLSDFYGVYTRRDDIKHGYCGAHLIREARQVAELSKSRETRLFEQRLSKLYRQGGLVRDGGTELARNELRRGFLRLATAPRFKSDKDLARLQKRMREHYEGLTLFIGRSDVEATNNATERDLRPLTVMRKVTGGTRSARGSQALGYWMSVTQTLHKNGLELADWMVEAERAHWCGGVMPSVFASTDM
jgi:transposase